MKDKLYLLIFLMLMTACSSGEKGQEANFEASVLENVSPESLSKEQLELAGVTWGKPEKRLLSKEVKCTGMIEVPPKSLYSIYSPVTGFVDQARYIIGDPVKKGDLLVKISHPDLIEIQKDFLEAFHSLKYKKQELDRLETLASKDAVAQQALNKARMEHDVQKAHYQGIKETLRMTGISSQQLEENGSLKSEVPLYAPADGYISTVRVNPGKLISPADLLLEIVDCGHMHLELKVFAKDARHVKKGQTIKFQIPGLEEVFIAEVFQTGKMVDQETKATRIHGHFEKWLTHYLPGTFVNASIIIEKDSVWALPEEAIIREDAQSYVFIQKEGYFEKYPIQTGRQSDGFVELISFAEDKARLYATSGAYYLNSVEAE